MNRIEANAFTTNWIRAWNKKDVDAVPVSYTHLTLPTIYSV